MYRPSICFCSSGIDACALWRMFIPHLHLPCSRFLFTQGVVPTDMIAECDVLYVQRLLTEGNLTMLQQAKALGMQIVYDLDDHIWALPNYNPAKHIFEKVKKEGHFEACMEWADVLTVSTLALRKFAANNTNHLRNVVTGKKIDIQVIENFVDLNLFYPADLPKDEDKIIIGWAGSNTHSVDLWEVWQLLPKILEDFKNVEMHFVGMLPPKEIENHERVKKLAWVHVSEFAARAATWNWDIFLAPLEMNAFNRCKSSIKMQEAAALGKPCLATDIENYTRFCLSGDKSLTWQLCQFSTQWDRKLRELITNKALRVELGQAMRKNVEDSFDIAKNSWRHQQLAEMLCRN